MLRCVHDYNALKYGLFKAAIQVDVCFLVDCTGSMDPYIEAVKNNIQQLRDRLEKEYESSDVVFSFVRYTDYDQSTSTRTTYLQFTG